jgi:hypothetical protein
MSACLPRYRWWLLAVAAICVTGYAVHALPPTKAHPIDKTAGPGWPHSVLAARLENKSAPATIMVLMLAFVLYFWGSSIFTIWKMGP